MVLDPDATGTLLHGQQEGRCFNTHHGDYCHLPLCVFCGNVPLCAPLRTSDHDTADGAVEAVAKIIAAIRRRFPQVRIILRVDSGFAREELIALCETDSEVSYCLGLPQHSRWLARVRTLGPAGSEPAAATAGSVRLKLLKVAARVRVSVRRLPVRMSSVHPGRDLFERCHRRLMWLTPASG